MTDEAKDKKIIIDEDWKSQVQAEREEWKKKEGSGEGPAAGGPSFHELPPASLPLLVSTLAAQTMSSLGQLPDPVENKPIVRLEHAKHHIDTLAILQEKTKGNLTPEEEQMIQEVIHQLRMLYVSVSESRSAASSSDSER